MMQKKIKNRLFRVLFTLISIAFGMYFILNSFSQDIVFYYPPSKIPKDKYYKTIRVGGIVKEHSINRLDIKTVSFKLYDNESEITILYEGALPNLFREKQGIVTKGVYDGKFLKADSLLAKHDEIYKPK